MSDQNPQPNPGNINISDISGGEIEIGAIVSGTVAGDVVGRDKIVNNISNITERALTAAEEAENARSIAEQHLAEGVRDYAQRLANIAVANVETDSLGGNPYKGLLPYRLGDAERFFGRDQAIAELLEHLQRSPLTILHAESGAGKSSLLQAGIANRLIGAGHLPVYLRPYNQSPVLAIRRAFLPQLGQTTGAVADSAAIYGELATAPLRDFLRRVTGILGQNAGLYVMLDQFEEAFTLLDDETRTNFVFELADCLEDESLNVRWVLALRTEFFGNLANFRPRLRNPFDNDYRLNRLNLLEAKTAITEPATRQGITLEPALVGTLLTDLHDEQSDEISPPQVQLVCSALYNTLQEQRSENAALEPTITLQLYEEEGRAEGILRGHLNRVLRRMLNAQEREAARQLLIALVSSNQRRIRRTKSDLSATLATYLTSAMSLDDLLDQLVESRLLNVEEAEQSDEPTYELAHDLLVSEIELDPETQARKAAQELLSQEADAFRRYGTLLSSDKFDIINSQREFLTLDDNATELLRLSQVARKRAQLQRTIAIAVVVILVVGSAVAIALIQSRSATQQAIAAATAEAGATRANLAEATAKAEKVLAETARREAEQQANLANAQRVVAEAQLLVEENPQQAMLLIAAAQQITETQTASQVLGQLYYTYPPLEATLAGHSDWVNSVAFSPDGRFLASASDDLTIVLWDVVTRQAQQTLTGHTDWVNSVAFSPDGSLLASASADGSIKLWSVETGQARQTLTHHTSEVMSVAFSPDGRLLASAAADATIILWDVESGQLQETLTGHNDRVNSVVFSPDGRLLASASDDTNIILWDAESGQPQQSLTGHIDWVNNVAFSPDGRLLASASIDKSIILWDIETGQIQQTLTGHTDQVNGVAFSPDGRRLASASLDKSIILWDVESGQPQQTLTGHNDWVFSVAFSPDGQSLASASADHSVLLWNVSSDQLHQTLTGHTNAVSGLAFSPDGRHLASASIDKSIILWNMDSAQPRQTLVGHSDAVNGLAFSPDSRRLASASFDNTIILWDVESGQRERTLEGHSGWVRSVAFSPDGRLLASASEDTSIILWEVESGQQIRSLRGHDSGVFSVDFSPDGRRLASGSLDSNIILWDVESGQVQQTLTGHDGWVFDVAFSPNGHLLASASEDTNIILWDVESGQARQTLSGHDDSVFDVAFSPDGHYLASASRDTSIILWDVATGQHQQTLSGHKDEVWKVAFSPNGNYLASGGPDQTIQLLKTAILQSSPCQIVSRNFTRAEWIRFFGEAPYQQTCPNHPISP